MRLRETIDWGIDLGTTNSAISVLKGTDIEMIKNTEGDETTPSAIYEKKTGNNVIKRFGKTAKAKLGEEPENVASEFKQMMGLKDWYHEFSSTGRKTSAIDLSADVLAELIRNVKEKMGENMHSAVITVPAAFLNPQYEDTKKAGSKTGLKYVELLEEPIAAALAYGMKADVSEQGRWLAYDLGGGTFDAALVNVEEGIFTVFDHEGLPNLGGKDLDAAIVEKCFIPELPSEIKNKIVPKKSPIWWRLKGQAEEAKCHLSSKNEYTIDLIIGDYNFLYTLTRDKLNELEEEIFTPTIEKSKELITRNGFKPQDFEKIILIGGATLSPNLRKMIENNIGIPLDHSIDPLTAVSKGAAVYAADRVVPRKIIKEISKNEGTHSVHVTMNYPRTTKDEEILLSGKIVSTDKKINISTDWSVEISKIEGVQQGQNEKVWSTGKFSIPASGGFAKTIPIKDGDNLFKIAVIDSEGRDVETDNSNISIKRLRVVTPGQNLARGIGVAGFDGNVIWFLEKGQPLPSEKSLVLTTTKSLKKGEKGDAINIPVVEGNEKKAILNRIVHTLKVTADGVRADIPDGSKVEVSIEINSSRSIKIQAYFEASKYEVEAEIEKFMDLNAEKVKKLFEEELETIKKLEDVKSYSPKITHALDDITGSNVNKDIKKLLSQNEDHESAQKAMGKLLELRKTLDPVLEEGNKLNRWQPRKKSCEENFVLFNKMFKKYEHDLSPQFERTYKKMLEDYEEAVDNKDFRGAFSIACGDLLDLFKDSEEKVTVDGMRIPLGQLFGTKDAREEGGGINTNRGDGDVRR